MAWLASRLRGARFVIDWHNLSHTIAAVKVGDRHRAVKAIARSERRGPGAPTRISPCRKRSPNGWRANTASRRRWSTIGRAPRSRVRPRIEAAELWSGSPRKPSSAPRRLPIVVCPTSWTPDEDFDLLLEALERTERQLKRDRRIRRDVTVAELCWSSSPVAALCANRSRRAPRGGTSRRIAVRTLWLEPADYPKLIGMADVGLCLHQSSSGLDLPMKLADFRGCGVPVAVFDYAPVLGEVMTSGQQGVTFRDPGELATVFVASPSGSIAAIRRWPRPAPGSRRIRPSAGTRSGMHARAARCFVRVMAATCSVACVWPRMAFPYATDCRHCRWPRIDPGPARTLRTCDREDPPRGARAVSEAPRQADPRHRDHADDERRRQDGQHDRPDAGPGQARPQRGRRAARAVARARCSA